VKDRQQLGIERARSSPRKTCGAPTPSGPCRHWAGFRTGHKGRGPCYLHDQGWDGAANLPAGIEDFYADFLRDRDFFELGRDMAFLRAAIHTLGRSRELDARTAGSLAGLAMALARLVTAAHKVALDRRYLVELPQVAALVETIVQLSRRYIPDDYQRQRFAEELGKALRGLTPREPRLPGTGAA
jgi:hypothetical protein